MEVNNKNLRFCLLFCLIAIFLSSFKKTSRKQDKLLRVRVIRVGNLWGSGIVDRHCEDFSEQSAFYKHFIDNPTLINHLEKYKCTAKPDSFFYKTNIDAQGRIFFYYKSKRIDTICFSGSRHFYLNGVSMEATYRTNFDLLQMLDTL